MERLDVFANRATGAEVASEKSAAPPPRSDGAVFQTAWADIDDVEGQGR
jgi:hypothetical protein